MSFDTCDRVSPECPVEYTLYGDFFTLGATATYAAIFGGFLTAQVPLTLRAKTWSYGAWLAAGTAFECIGYICRCVMSQNPWNYDAFVGQYLCLVLGPTLAAAAISLTFKHLVIWFGVEYSLIRPGLYPWVFVGTDFISICIQAAGGGIASASTSGSTLGNNLLLAGVCFQVVNMVFCGGLILAYVWRRRRALSSGSARTADDYASTDSEVPPCWQGSSELVCRNGRNVRIFVWGLVVAYITIVIRCTYRIPEMTLGWGSTLMQNEATFMSLDGAMLIIACGALTACHPAFFFSFMGRNSKGKPTNASEFELISGNQ
ncbi:hypothetical protein S7711_09121 [Stachybotrys chartarum IBT 7711]|uniref:Uncharacterized protein n=1 Tax=Stachybotrys chartarum (strain CBS 109288 / IBT 7711) TaxID=1280523 RepID=A0A084B2Y9_STACB|nr:hypothetical protein S7711_09121 [Stachybotrys chartarum IBT 7711]KFA56348.1 hypothetical protein S40293_08747 [Stachybotrys chartarum IBT 40293]